MVCVRLVKEWVDAAGPHAAGDMVDVDAGTLAELEAAGVVVGPAEPGTPRADLAGGPEPGPG